MQARIVGEIIADCALKGGNVEDCGVVVGGKRRSEGGGRRVAVCGHGQSQVVSRDLIEDKGMVRGSGLRGYRRLWPLKFGVHSTNS